MERKGISYIASRELLGEDWRPDFNPQVVHRELEIIKNDLYCNTVRICGKDIDRLTLTAQDALRQGFEVWLSPDLWDHTEPETLEYVIAAAKQAEKLRQQWPDRVVITVGSELTLFMKGILGGETFLERVDNPVKLMFTLLRLKYLGMHNKLLNEFLARANQGVREVFHGPVTYASAPVEKVDWSLFDFVCVDYYRGKQNRADYSRRLQRYFTYGKPVVITEVGCCTYRGAEDKGGRAFMIVDRKHPDQLQPGYDRDEGLQAREDVDMLSELSKAGVNGAFVFTFIMPTMKYREDPLRDFDKASYSLVKSFEDGRHGTSYPEMAWEPKEAFRAVAKYYKG
jgi:hypothetical protein